MIQTGRPRRRKLKRKSTPFRSLVEDADFLYDCLAYSDHMKACDSARVEEMIARIRLHRVDCR